MTTEIAAPLSITDEAAAARQNAKDWLSRALMKTPGARGRVLRRMRGALNLTQVEVARHMPARSNGRPYRRGGEPQARTVHQHTISAIESEEVGMPRGFVREYVFALDRALRERDAMEAAYTLAATSGAA